ncbi:MAG: hypothetical protein LBM77_03740 [Spirochaetaceae bacterium]|jgi:DNA repair exonuclease SbcCD ATPase subunit|nr:hypothetical protein [Spirochaetaceae bacterium]
MKELVSEKITQLLDYAKLSAISLLNIPKIEKKDLPDYIKCPRYEKAMGNLNSKMERYKGKVDRLETDISQMKSDIAVKSAQFSQVKDEMEEYTHYDGSVMDSYINKYNRLVPIHNDLLEQIRKQSEKHDDAINRLTEAKEEAKERLEEITSDAISAIDEDIPAVIDRLEGIVSNLADSDEAEDLFAAIDICTIALRIYVISDDLIDDNSARKECKESIEKINQLFAKLCSQDSIQNYMVDIYRRNVDLMQRNAAILKQIDGVLDGLDKKQLDDLSQSINALLTEQFNTKFDYNEVADQDGLDKIINKINATIDSLKANIEKAKSFQAVESSAVELGKAGVNAENQVKPMISTLQTNIDALDDHLTQNHFALQIIDESVIDEFYQKDLRVAVAALRKYIVDTIGEQNFEDLLKGVDDHFSLGKAQNAIESAKLMRLQDMLNKIPNHIKEIEKKIKDAETDISKANEIIKKNMQMVWQRQGRCAYCGGEFKGIFKRRCIKCGKEQNYWG